jgi:hypothetical protein
MIEPSYFELESKRNEATRPQPNQMLWTESGKFWDLKHSGISEWYN